MKSLICVLGALAAIALLAPGAGFAQWENRIGIYTTSTADAANIDPPPGNISRFTVYFILTNPIRDGIPLIQIRGWEYKVTIIGNPDGLIRLFDTLPTDAVNSGDASDPYNATYQLGIATPMSVVNNMVVLHSWNFLMIDDSAPYYFYLSPLPPDVATFDGRLGILDADNNALAASASLDDYTYPVFVIGEMLVIGVESASFGGFKALFR